MQDHVIGIGHNNPPASVVAPPWLAGRRAVIRRRGRPVGTAGRAHADEWILVFERSTPPEIDDLMGWTGGSDTLATEVRLTFATRAEAIAYAERQGLDYGIENFWVSCIVQFGLIHTALMTTALVVFFAKMYATSDRAVIAQFVLITVIAASSVSFSSKNIQLAQFVVLIALLSFP
ncbi:NADH dehydrogenase ubiquinone Fe-S protein 4, partial [uncultured Methylobacterium sp.]|uniref:NADH dehydrogenase ubiquinone Fe-S protein 4 n=1 Tax=uncultured Methylobacterium sp. TaxID=157278 RepID=UPI002593FA4B